MKDIDYNEIFINAKDNTVYSHAMVWIKAIITDEMTEREKFIEIHRIVIEACNHLNE